MKRWWSVVFLIIFLFILGCKTQPETPEDAAGLVRFARSGVRGLEMNFVEGMPPNSIYDISDLIVVGELKNTGAYDLAGDKCFLELSGPDWSIIRGLTKRQSCGEIIGKSIYNTEGGFNQVEFSSRSIYLPGGVDKYTPNLVLSACYDYKTTASPQVCIDPDFYQLTTEQKSCVVRDVSLGGGQGAPVSVDFINVDMAGDKALFEINVNNAGGGKIISPRIRLDLCPGNLRYDDFDEVSYSVMLSGHGPEKCTPGGNMVKLYNGKGKIFCTFKIGNTAAYEAPLNVELNYNYMQSISKKIDIIKTPR